MRRAKSRPFPSAWAVAGLGAVLLLAPGTPILAGYLESDYPQTKPAVVPPPRPIPPRPPRPIPPPPERRNEVTALLDDLLVDGPYHYRGLTLFPLTLSSGEDHRAYQTLDEGLANGTVTVKERAGGVVSELVLANTAHIHTFILAGELLLGGKQNRLIREDLLLPPKSGDVVVPVYCGQKGRWSADTKFHTKDSMANSNVRQRALAGAPQAEVWSGIREDAGRLQALTESEDLQQVYDSPENRRALADYRTNCIDYLRRRPAVGFVVARYGTIVGAEVFRSRSLFQRLQGKLIDSYAVDCLGWEPETWRRRPTGQPTVEQARTFLSRAYQANYSVRSTPGAGRLLVLTGRSTGQALGLQGSCVHLSLYERVPIPIRPVPPPVPIPLPIPRPRLEE